MKRTLTIAVIVFFLLLIQMPVKEASAQYAGSARKNAPPVEPKRGMVGIQLGHNDGKFYVQQVFKNSPAERAGLKGGDILLRVGEQDLSGLSLPEVLNLFNGDPSSEVEVAVFRGGLEVPPLKINRVSPKKLYEKSEDFKKVVNARKNTSPQKKQQKEVIPPQVKQVTQLDKDKLDKWLKHYEKVYGFRAVLLDDKFGEKLGAIFNEGVLVLEVKLGTPAYKAGLEKWDLIHRIEGKIPVEYFKTNQPPSDASGPLPLNITLMGLTGEKDMKL